MGVLKWMGVLNTYSHVCPAHWPWCWYPNHFFAVNEPFCLFHGGDVTCFDVMKLLAEWDEVINSTRTKLLHLPQKVTRNSSLIFSLDFQVKTYWKYAMIHDSYWFDATIKVFAQPIVQIKKALNSECPVFWWRLALAPFFFTSPPVWKRWETVAGRTRGGFLLVPFQQRFPTSEWPIISIWPIIFLG